MSINILYLDNNKDTTEKIESTINKAFPEFYIKFIEDENLVPDSIQDFEYDFFLLNLNSFSGKGERILKTVTKISPHTLKAIISGNTENEFIIRNENLSQFYVNYSKLDESLTEILKRAEVIISLLADKNLISIINTIEFLPSLPEIYIELEKEIKSEEYSTKKVAEIISSDVAIFAKVLKLVNSSYIGLSHKVTDPVEAVKFLGANSIKTMVLYLKIFSNFLLPKNAFFTLEDLWHHSFTVAKYSKKIMSKFTNDKVQLDEAYAAGLLHDVGKLAMTNLPNYFAQLDRAKEVTPTSLRNLEKLIWGTTHAEVGGYLMGMWDFPESVIKAVAFHHRPTKSLAEDFDITGAVHLANIFTKMEDLDLNYLHKTKSANQFIKYFEEVQEY